MAFVSVITPDQARQAGEQVWELTLTNWGNQGALADLDSNRYGSVLPGTSMVNPAPPPARIPFPNVPGQFVLPPVVSLAIAPDSYVDAVFFESLFPFIPGSASSFLAQQRTLTHERPWYGQLTSPIIFFSESQTAQLTSVTGGSSNVGTGGLIVGPTIDRTFTDTFEDINGNVSPFGTALNAPGDVRFIVPRLNVLMYIGNPPASVPRRSPFGERSISVGVNAVDTVLRVWPVMGRRRIRLVMQAVIGGPSNVRISGVDRIGFPPFFKYVERVLSGPTAVGNTAVTATLDTPITNFLLLRANGPATTFEVGIEAID